MEAHAKEELPEKFLGAVSVYHYQMEMSSATFVEASHHRTRLPQFRSEGWGLLRGITTSRGCEDREDEGRATPKREELWKISYLLEIRNI